MIVASLVLVVLLVAVVAAVCLRRKRKALHLMMGKNMAGHYNGKDKYRIITSPSISFTWWSNGI